jgi:hypothetical protein
MTQDLRALPADLFTKPSIVATFRTFCEVVETQSNKLTPVPRGSGDREEEGKTMPYNRIRPDALFHRHSIAFFTPLLYIRQKLSAVASCFVVIHSGISQHH